MSSARKYLVIVVIQSGSQSGIVWDNNQILKRRKSWQKNERWNSCLTLWTNMFFPILHFTEQNKNEQHLHNGCLLLKIWQKTKASQTNKSTGHVWHDLSSILNCSQLLRTMCLCMVFKELEWLSCCFWMIKHQAVDLCGSNYAVPFPVASTSAKISWRSSCCHISVTNNPKQLCFNTTCCSMISSEWAFINCAVFVKYNLW